MKKKFPRNLLLALGLLALVFFLVKVDFGQLVKTFQHIDTFYLLIAILFTLLNISAKAFRWVFLVRRSAEIKIPFPLAMLSIFAGVASGSLFPAKTLDLAKPLIIQEYHPQSKFSSMLGVVFVERLFDLAILLIALGALTLFSQTVLPAYVLIGSFAILILVLLTAEGIVAFFRKLLNNRAAINSNDLIGKSCASLSSFLAPLGNWTNPKLSLPLLGYSAAAEFFEFARIYSVLQAVGLKFSFIESGISFATSVVLGLLSMIPGGIGITENSQSAILAKLAPGADLSQIGGGVLLDRMISYYAIILIGAVILVALKIRPDRRTYNDNSLHASSI